MANEKRLIDRNEIFPNGTFFANAEDPMKSLDELIKRIWSIPTVDAVEVVHGYNTGKARWFQCSECGYGFNDIFLLDESEEMLEPKYCAYCGAKMDGDGNA